ncbi:MAG: O-antigen ligase family protein [Gaiellaceae bacterium]
MQALLFGCVALPILAGSWVVWRRPALALYAFLVGLALHNSVMAALYGAGLRGSPLTLAQAWKEILLATALLRIARDSLRARQLPFRFLPVDWLAAAFGLLVGLYALVPQDALGGAATTHAVALAARHDLVPVGAYLLGRSLRLGSADIRRLVWTVVVAAAVVAGIGLVDDYAVSIGWWRGSPVRAYFHDQLGYDYHGTGVNAQGKVGLPENFIYNTGSEQAFLRRLVSVFLSPLATAYMLVFALLAIAVGGPLRRHRRLVGALGILCAAGLLYTFTRSAMLALVMALLPLAFLTRRLVLLPVAAAALVVVVAWGSLFQHVAPTGHWTKLDLAYQRKLAQEHPGASGSPFSASNSSTRSHLSSLRDGVSTIVHHPQGFGLGNVGQTASRTGTPIKAGESNYTEVGAETGLFGALLWIAWCLALLTGLVLAALRLEQPLQRAFAALMAVMFAATLAIAVQTDVIGDPWMGYCVWGLAGAALALAPATVRAREPAAGVAERGDVIAPGAA